MSPGSADGPDWFEVVARLGDNDVRALLASGAGVSETVARMVRLAAADPEEQIGVLRAEVDRGLRTRRHLDYWQSSDWAIEAAPVVDALAAAVAAGPTAELVTLLERAIGHLVKVLLRADDSNGTIGDLARRVLDLHALACDAQVADPVALATWMVRFSFDDHGFFEADPVRYAAALGDEGLARYRTEVAKRGDGDAFPYRYAMERLAVVDGDVDGIVTLIGGDLSTPQQFVRVVEALLEIDRLEEALSLAMRGLGQPSGWPVAKLYDLAAGILERRDEGDALLQLRRDEHARMPSASTYRKLQAASGDVWASEVAAARTALGDRDRGGLIDALLSDGDVADAWELAWSDPAWDPGPQRGLLLAKGREPDEPAEAMGVYLRLADIELLTTGRPAYLRAARRLKDARRAADAAGAWASFAAHLATLREQHKRRPALLAVLDKAKLP
jgi:hypothetical protein